VAAIGILGLGEAGGTIAGDLRAAGATVCGFDPDPSTSPDAPDTETAVGGADLVLSLTTAAEALTAARAAAPALREGQVYADANTSGAELKRAVAAVVEPSGAAFADIALMAPVPGRGITTPALAAGAGAAAAAAILGPYGMPVTVLDGAEPGAAATRKLLRSVAWKGTAAVVCEALAAARVAGLEDWMRGEILGLLSSADESTLRRMEDGSRQHAVRRAHEMSDVGALLRELGVSAHMSDAARAQLEELARVSG
jgi:3-hydroxyisobutyrate dehydrogenase-like beta-hydroxyacid dehydrogenase